MSNTHTYKPGDKITCPRCQNPNAQVGYHFKGLCPKCFHGFRTDRIGEGS